MRRVAAACKLGTYLLFTFLLMPVQAGLLVLWSRGAVAFPLWYHRQCLKILAIQVQVIGTPVRAGRCLYVSNHSSYLDIPVLGSVLPACFIAKAEVASWPLFGWLARLSRTLFLDRRISKLGEGQTALLTRLRAGDNLILFAEGTSSDGLRVLPFKRGLFQAVLAGTAELQLCVQPVQVMCVGINGMNAGRSDKLLYAWFGDMTLPPHLWRICQLRSCQVQVTFASPLPAFADPHQLTSAAQVAVTG